MSSNLPNSIEQEKLTAYIREAGAKLLHYWGSYHQRGGELEIQVKADGSSVTEADFASNEILVAGIRTLFPSDGILSEELPITAELRAENRVWIIDPLDGTKSFIQGRDDFSILVGLTVSGLPTFGVMYFPARDHFVISKKGSGATVNDAPMSVSQSQTLRENSLYLIRCTIPGSILVCTDLRDSGLVFYQVANGELDGAILRLVTHKDWDLAAPFSAIQESGGVVTDERGESVRLNQETLPYKYIIVSNGKVHNELLELLNKLEE